LRPAPDPEGSAASARRWAAREHPTPLARHWYRWSALTLALLPLAGLFALLAALRRHAYRRGWLRPVRLPVPVIVVGNLTVGGTGKTPLTAWLAERLTELGWHPGIVSRGHVPGRGAADGSARIHQPATRHSDPALVGDEPVLLAARTGCPVWVGADRPFAARALIAANPAVDLILCDDGLQHYRLARDLEIAVVDGQLAFGNGLPLPAGPLREPRRRLRAVDAVVLHAAPARADAAGAAAPGLGTLGAPTFVMRLAPTRVYRLDAPPDFDSGDTLRRWRGQRVHAVAGLGNPLRFFALLEAHGLEIVRHPFPDHHAYAETDVAFDDALPVLITEKDAVKLRRIVAAPLAERIRVVAVDAEIDGALVALLRQKLEALRLGPETARHTRLSGDQGTAGP
jgi:tetraacyldisaccharide 4'-kinase